MSEVEKMYKKVGLASHFCNYPRFCDDNNCNECPNYSSEFTAEKQIELIKWLAIHKWGYGLQYFGKQWTNCCEFECDNFEEGSEDVDFEQSLSGLINIIWQSLTEQERTEIAEILRG